MPNTGGTNGAVSSVTESATSAVVTVTYPGPPPRTETYEPAPAWLVRRADAAKEPTPKIDVVCDEAGTPTSAKNHA